MIEDLWMENNVEAFHINKLVVTIRAGKGISFKDERL